MEEREKRDASTSLLQYIRHERAGPALKKIPPPSSSPTWIFLSCPRRGLLRSPCSALLNVCALLPPLPRPELWWEWVSRPPCCSCLCTACLSLVQPACPKSIQQQQHLFFGLFCSMRARSVKGQVLRFQSCYEIKLNEWRLNNGGQLVDDLHTRFACVKWIEQRGRGGGQVRSWEGEQVGPGLRRADFNLGDSQARCVVQGIPD